MLGVALLRNSLVDQGGSHLHLQRRYFAGCEALHNLIVGCNGGRPFAELFLCKSLAGDQSLGDGNLEFH